MAIPARSPVMVKSSTDRGWRGFGAGGCHWQSMPVQAPCRLMRCARRKYLHAPEHVFERSFEHGESAFVFAPVSLLVFGVVQLRDGRSVGVVSNRARASKMHWAVKCLKSIDLQLLYTELPANPSSKARFLITKARGF